MFTSILAVFVLAAILLIVIPGYQEWKFYKYYQKDFPVYDFKCPSCSAKSDRMKIIDFDNCCHGVKFYKENDILHARGYAGSTVSCINCKQIMYIVYFLSDLEENNITGLYKLLKEKPKSPGEFPVTPSEREAYTKTKEKKEREEGLERYVFERGLSFWFFKRLVFYTVFFCFLKKLSGAVGATLYFFIKIIYNI